LKKRYDPNNVFDKLWKLVGEVEDNNWIAWGAKGVFSLAE
jgi:hypothetical protein